MHARAIPARLVFERDDMVLGYSFADAQIDGHMQKLFGMFPTFLLNEVMALANNGLGGLGSTASFDFWPVPNTCQ